MLNFSSRGAAAQRFRIDQTVAAQLTGKNNAQYEPEWDQHEQYCDLSRKCIAGTPSAPCQQSDAVQVQHVNCQPQCLRPVCILQDRSIIPIRILWINRRIREPLVDTAISAVAYVTGIFCSQECLVTAEDAGSISTSIECHAIDELAWVSTPMHRCHAQVRASGDLKAYWQVQCLTGLLAYTILFVMSLAFCALACTVSKTTVGATSVAGCIAHDLCAPMLSSFIHSSSPRCSTAFLQRDAALHYTKFAPCRLV